jgi:hypothetical protein
MGWTWSGQSREVLQNYPSIANVPLLVERWPGLKEAVAAMRAGQGTQQPTSGGSPSAPAPAAPKK